MNSLTISTRVNDDLIPISFRTSSLIAIAGSFHRHLFKIVVFPAFSWNVVYTANERRRDITRQGGGGRKVTGEGPNPKQNNGTGNVANKSEKRAKRYIVSLNGERPVIDYSQVTEREPTIGLRAL